MQIKGIKVEWTQTFEHHCISITSHYIVYLGHYCLKRHCNGKIVDLILIATEQHFRTKLNGAFSFSISCLVSEIFKFLNHAN